MLHASDDLVEFFSSKFFIMVFNLIEEFCCVFLSLVFASIY